MVIILTIWWLESNNIIGLMFGAVMFFFIIFIYMFDKSVTVFEKYYFICLYYLSIKKSNFLLLHVRHS